MKLEVLYSGSRICGEKNAFPSPYFRFWHNDIVFEDICTLATLFRQTEIVLKDSTAFVYVTKSEKSSH